MSTCRGCDARWATTPQGFCVPCQDDLRFITRPVAHREQWRRAIAGGSSFYQEMAQRGVIVVTDAPADNAEWICDFCNDQIPITAEHTLIPLIGSYALCTPCVTRFDYWPDAWTHPAPRACLCDACQLPLQRLALRDRIHQQERYQSERGQGLER